MRIVFTYKNGFAHTVVIRRPMTRAIAEVYRIKYASPDNDRGVVVNGRQRIGLDEYIRMEVDKSEKQRFERIS